MSNSWPRTASWKISLEVIQMRIEAAWREFDPAKLKKWMGLISRPTAAHMVALPFKLFTYVAAAILPNHENAHIRVPRSPKEITKT